MNKKELFECVTVFNESVTSIMKAFDKATYSAQQRSEEKYCYNISYEPSFEFICSECGTEVKDYRLFERDKDSGGLCCALRFGYCPSCGRKVVV